MPLPHIENGYRSVESRPIEVHVYGKGPRTAMVMAGVHGDEQNGVEVVRILQTALAQLPESALAGTRVVVMPVANPDGYAANTRQNANGIDLNRNFPDKSFGSGAQSGEYFGGAAAASEPETRAIMDVICGHEPYLVVSLHEALACVNYNGPSLEVAQRMSDALGLPVTSDIGYPCPGSMGNYYGFDLNLPLITLELPKEEVDAALYSGVLMDVMGVAGH